MINELKRKIYKHWITRSFGIVFQGGIGFNAISNLLSRLWSALLNIISVPLYIRYLGPEAYGLVGLYVSFEIIFQFLDLGLSATINREIARNIATNQSGNENKNTLRTFEFFYWPIGVVIALLISSLSEWIAIHWVNIQNLTYQTVKVSIIVMAITFAARWPMTLYAGALFGLQKQVHRNLVNVIVATMRITTSIFVLVYVSQNITIFLAWQVLFYAFEVIILMLLVWKELGKTSTEKPRISSNVIKRVWKFAVSFNIIGVLRSVMFSGDRLIASKYVPLSDIGYYSVASTASGVLPLVADAIGIAIYPRFAADIARNDYPAVAEVFHRYLNLVHYSVFGFGAILILFPTNVLYLWIKDWHVVENSAPLLIFLAIAYTLISISNLFYLLLTASGNTKILLILNSINFIVLLPALFLLTPKFGIIVVAILMALVNLFAYIVYVLYVGKIFLKGYSVYLIKDILPYLTGAIAWFASGKIICHFWVNGLSEYGIIIFATLGYFTSLAPRIIKKFIATS